MSTTETCPHEWLTREGANALATFCTACHVCLVSPTGNMAKALYGIPGPWLVGNTQEPPDMTEFEEEM